MTLSNANPGKDIAVRANLAGITARQVRGRVLQGEAMNAHNTFEQPNTVAPRPFAAAKLGGDHLEVTLPRMSVVSLEIV